MNPADVPDGPLIIDTDVASWIRAGHARANPFKSLLRDHVLCLSFATVAELWAGAENAGWGQARRDGLEAFIRVHVILPVDEAVTRFWAQIHAVLRDQVDVNDEWTAACALAQTPSLHRHRKSQAFPADRGKVPDPHHRAPRRVGARVPLGSRPTAARCSRDEGFKPTQKLPLTCTFAKQTA